MCTPSGSRSTSTTRGSSSAPRWTRTGKARRRSANADPRGSGRRKPTAHRVGEGDLIRETSQVVRSHTQAASPSQVGQPRVRVALFGLIVIGKHDIQHVAGQVLEGGVLTEVARIRRAG